ncbi:hypothetical protein BDP27DRAFT_1340023 [Rhodocollybia butyracea]|uniref:Uncharacterized protein n=1 Tax=Rhodocollybia butyracea TaxID=206335 RepID=A0A9P5TY81_9AGAR|nr:hypothetical protein BDP27DRAFT_1340023 [Rhodocollybia butyracea]
MPVRSSRIVEIDFTDWESAQPYGLFHWGPPSSHSRVPSRSLHINLDLFSLSERYAGSGTGGISIISALCTTPLPFPAPFPAARSCSPSRSEALVNFGTGGGGIILIFIVWILAAQAPAPVQVGSEAKAECGICSVVSPSPSTVSIRRHRSTMKETRRRRRRRHLRRSLLDISAQFLSLLVCSYSCYTPTHMSHYRMCSRCLAR